MIGDAQVRNWGTIGGNVAHADPASDLPTVLVALDARLIVEGPEGRRRIAATDFFQGMMATSLDGRDILTAVDVPARLPGQGMAYVKFAHPRGLAICRRRRGGRGGRAGRQLHGRVRRDWRSASCRDAA